MLFEKLVQQHRVHRLVAHGVRLSVSVASDQIRIYLRHLLGHESELRDARRVELVLVAKGHRFERQDRFARLVHRLDCILETLRGYGRAKMTTAIYNNCYTRWNGCPTDASDVSSGLSSYRTDTDRIRLRLKTSAANIDIVTSCGQILTGLKA